MILNSPKSRFRELDALRGIAALMVVFFHYSMPYLDTVTNAAFRYGTTGVDLFFIISGFVIFQSISQVKTGTEFIINRFSRLYPTYWTAVTFTLLVYIFTEQVVTNSHRSVLWEVYWYNMTMFQYYAGVADMDGPYWTMILEMLFYLVVFILFITRLLQFIIPLFVILIGFTTLLTEYYKGYGHEFYSDFLNNFPLSQFLPLFLSGIVFYRMAVYKERRLHFFIILIGCYLAQILLFRHGGRSIWYISHTEYKIVILVYFLLFFLFVYGKLKWIVNPITLFLGKISFPLYLIHQYVSIQCIIPNMIKAGFNYYVAAFLVALPICLIVATVIAFTVENHISAFVRKWLINAYYQAGNKIEFWMDRYPFSRVIKQVAKKF